MQVQPFEIKDYYSYINALRNRHEYFHLNGCRLSDHGVDKPYAEEYTPSEIDGIFAKIRSNKALDPVEQAKFKSAMLVDFGIMNYEPAFPIFEPLYLRD